MLKLMAIGSVVRDATFQTSKNGNPFCRFTLRTSKKVKGEWKSQFLSCIMFGNRAETLTPFLLDKTQIFIEGEPEAQSWKDKAGETKVNLSVIVYNLEFLSEKQTESKKDFSDIKPEFESMPQSLAGGTINFDDIPF